MSPTTTIPLEKLQETARRLAAGGRGILAADESIGTMSQRLEGAGVTASVTARRDYRELLLTAPGLAEQVSGIIVCDETFGQCLADGRTFPEACHELGILPGIKVDTGTQPIDPMQGAGSSPLITTGLDGLDERMASYAERGAAFAKWRAVFDVATIDAESARANAEALAEYAAVCQRHGVVPIVEPEVLCVGDHDLIGSARATRMALTALFTALAERGVEMSGIVLKPNFVSPGLECMPVTARTVATVTADVLGAVVPADVPTIAFLSGGNSTERVCSWLRELNAFDTLPWSCTFSFGRALVNDALATWAGDLEQVPAAQEALVRNCTQAAAAVR